MSLHSGAAAAGAGVMPLTDPLNQPLRGDAAWRRGIPFICETKANQNNIPIICTKNDVYSAL